MNEKMNTPLGSAFPKERVRYAMLSFFLAQGLCFSSWASRIPDVKDIFEVNYAFYWGLVLFLIPVGKFVAIPLAGYWCSKLGSRIMAQASVLGYALAYSRSVRHIIFICWVSIYSVLGCSGIFAIYP